MTKPPPPPRRGVRCEEHGIFYNPFESSGCVLCRRNQPVPAARTGSQAVTASVLIFGVLIVGALFWYLGGSGPGSVEATEGDPAPPSFRLDPAPYRAQIEELEGVLYQQTPPDFTTPATATRSAFELAQSMMARSLTDRVAALEVLSFAAEMDVVDDVGYALIDLEDQRSRWEVVRAKVFKAAPWFRQSGKKR